MRTILKLILLMLLLLQVNQVLAQSEEMSFYQTQQKVPLWLAQIKMAIDGTWKYENNDTTLVIRLKTIFPKRDFDKTTYINAIGTYSLKIEKCLIEDNHYLMFLIQNDSYYNSLFFNRFPIRMMMGGYRYIVQCLLFKDLTREEQNGNFYFRFDSLDSSNQRISYDFTDRDPHCGFYIYFSDTESKGEGFSIPEKCTLTRISHDPYYGLEEQEIIENAYEKDIK